MEILTGKRTIAKNAIFLYLRTLLLVLISLFTSRIVINELGADDFGLYNVVGSLVILFSFIQSSLASSASRFLSYGIGGGDEKGLRDTFCMIVNVHIIFAVIIFVFIETFGLWYFLCKLVIPENRYVAAFIVFQLSSVNAILSILVVPYRALIISFEKMKMFAYFSIAEGLFKLLSTLLLVVVLYDKLIIYGVCLFLIQFIVNILYLNYCRKNIHVSTYHYVWQKDTFKELIKYSFWSLCSYAPVIVLQSVNILFNAFFSLVVNAANAIAIQIQTQTNNLVINFQTAINPQIVKSYACADLRTMSDLIVFSSKISFSILFVVLLPFFANIDFILDLWLGQVPEFTNIFIIILCCYSTVGAFSNALSTATEAANKIKELNILLFPYYLSIIPISYVLFMLGCPPYMPFVLLLIFEIAAFYIKLYIAKKHVSIDISMEKTLFIKCLFVAIVAVFICLSLHFLINNTLIGFISKCIILLLFSIPTVYYFLFNNYERHIISNYLKSMLIKNN